MAIWLDGRRDGGRSLLNSRFVVQTMSQRITLLTATCDLEHSPAKMLRSHLEDRL